VHYGWFALITLILLVVQSTMVPFAALEGVTPDLLLILVVIIALRQGQTAGTIAGFAIGLASDLVMGDFLGLGALTKTVAGFVAGYFYNQTNPLQSLSTYRFIIAVAVSGLAHNVIYYTLLLQGLPVGAHEIIFKYMVGSTFYSLVLSLVPYFHYTSRYRSVRT
jgi:rod shape-determining protein MreD